MKEFILTKQESERTVLVGTVSYTHLTLPTIVHV